MDRTLREQRSKHSHPQPSTISISIVSQDLCFAIPSIKEPAPGIKKDAPLPPAVHRVGSIVAIPVKDTPLRLIMDCAGRTTERRRRSVCRSRDRRIPQFHRSVSASALLGTALSIVKTPSSTTLRSLGQGIVGSFVESSAAASCALR